MLYAIARGDLAAQKLEGRQGAYVLDQAEIDRYVSSRVRRSK